MYHKVFKIILVAILCLPFMGRAQTGPLGLQKKEVYLQHQFQQLFTAKDEKARLMRNHAIKDSLSRILTLDSSFFYPFDSLSSLGKVMAPDSAFRLLTWNCPLSGGMHVYSLFIQYISKITGKPKIIFLENNRIEKPVFQINEDSVLEPEQWYGALYYDILANTTDTGKYYTLLGIDLNDLFTTRKVIDILWFDKDQHIHFGLPVFIFPDHVSHRVVFEFSARVSMLLHYDPEMNMIVFDHLSPSDPSYKGIYQFYGPDFSYDGFIYRQGQWIFRSDLDVRNQK